MSRTVVLDKKRSGRMSTSETNVAILWYFLIGIFIAIFIVSYSTTDFSKEIETPTAAQAIITGTVSLNIIPACALNFSTGWNFVSFCVNATNKSITSVLGPINQSIRFVLEWNTNAQEFIVYSPKSSDPPFTDFNFSKSYFIYYTDATGSLLEMNGPSYNDVNLSLQQGWETPNYPYSFTANVTKYLNTIAGKYLFLQKWNYTPQEFIIYSAVAADNPFYQIYMGEGQFLLITDAGGADLFYNKTDLESG